MEVEVVPHSMDAEDIIAKFENKEIDGVFLSNGPGDPLILKDEQAKITKLIAHKIPLFGICLGHQLLSIAHGYDTYKLQFGHHGGTHTNLFDNTIEGLKYNNSPSMSVQHHPEASPGPHESAYIFGEFAKML